jgi:hypothetical protein
VLDKCIKLGELVVSPRRRDANRYASNGIQRIAYELHGTRHRWRPWLILVQGHGVRPFRLGSGAAGHAPPVPAGAGG